MIKSKRKIWMVLVAFVMIVGCINADRSEVNAALNTAEDFAFDYIFYSDMYSDLKKEFGYNEAALKSHWLTFGIKEGRAGSPVYDGKCYLNSNSDLVKAYGRTNYAQAYNHFITYGYKEKRTSSKYYNAKFYANRYSDLRNMSSNDLMKHYLEYGIGEKRLAGLYRYTGSTANAVNASANSKLQIKGSRVVTDGNYKIVSKLNGTSCIDIQNGNMENGSNAHLWTMANAQNQLFKIEYIGSGYYRIIATHSGKVLDIHNGEIKNGSNLKQWDWADVLQQKWVLVNRGNGYYSIHSAKDTQYVIDVNGGSSGNGTNIQIYRYNGSNAQLFKLKNIGDLNNGNISMDGFQWPVTNYRVCGNAWSEYYWRKGGDHLGVDIDSTSGDANIYAAGNGVVSQAGWSNANGNTVTIKHNISGKNIYTFYGHLNSVSVSKGDNVIKGQKIGVIGNTGASSKGVHLHFAFTTQSSAGTYGYGNIFSDNINVTEYYGFKFYNPTYIIENNKLP